MCTKSPNPCHDQNCSEHLLRARPIILPRVPQGPTSQRSQGTQERGPCCLRFASSQGATGGSGPAGAGCRAPRQACPDSTRLTLEHLPTDSGGEPERCGLSTFRGGPCDRQALSPASPPHREEGGLTASQALGSTPDHRPLLQASRPPHETGLSTQSWQINRGPKKASVLPKITQEGEGGTQCQVGRAPKPGPSLQRPPGQTMNTPGRAEEPTGHTRRALACMCTVRPTHCKCESAANCQESGDFTTK